MYRWFWSFLKGERARMAGAFALTLICSALGMVNPALTGFLVDHVILGKDFALLWSLLAILLGATILRMGLRWVFVMTFEGVSQRLVKSMRESLFLKIQNLDFAYFDRTKTGDIMALMTGDLDTCRHLISWVGYQTFENSLIFLFSIVVLFTIHPGLTLTLVAITPFIFLCAYFLARDVRPMFSKVREQFSRVNSVVQENIAGNRIVKAFVREDEELRKFRVENAEYRDRNLTASRVWGKYIPIIEFLSGLLMVIMVAGGGWLILEGQMTVGQLVVFTGLVWALTQPLRMAGWLINDMQRFVASLERLFELSQVQSDLQVAAEPVRPTPVRGKFEFDHVSFAYGTARVLEDLSFTVEAGQTVAIVGPTGSGKSTLIRLLARFQDPTSGTVRLDGVDLKDWAFDHLRANIGYAMQDVFLFSDTLEGNIVFGRPSATLEEAIEASQRALADEFIQKMQDGYDTIVGERGIGLSGGQRQRVALARLLLADPPVIVLDDTTSALDLETEARLQQTLRALSGKKTVFLVAHRWSTVQHADLVLVLNHGRITQRGTHQQLIQEPGWYQEVHFHQLGKENHHGAE